MSAPRVTPRDGLFVAALGLAALWLSYTALADLAARAGLGRAQAAVWPLVVDGLILAGTWAVVTFAADNGARRYAWALLWLGAVVSVAGNIAHVLLPAGPLHPAVGTAVAVVPPAAALAVTHLAIVRARARTSTTSSSDNNRPENIMTESIASDDAPASHASAQLTVVAASEPAEETRPDDVPADPVDALRHRARQLRADGWSNYAIADEIGKSEATVRRWLAAPVAS